MSNINKNLSWVNNLKVICMVLIYLNHSEIYCDFNIGPIRNVYLPVFVLSFFFVSGYLLFRKQLSIPICQFGVKEWIKTKGGGKSLVNNILFKIVIPSILFSSVIYFPKVLLRGQVLDLSDFVFQTIGGCSFWFTSALALAEFMIVVLLLTRIKTISFYVLVGVLTALIGSVAFKFNVSICGNPNFPWFWKASTSAVFYMSMGGLYGKYENIIDKILRTKNWFFIVLYILLYSYYCIFDFRAYNGGNYSCAVTIQSAILSIVGILIMVALSKKLHPIKFTEYWGRNTLGLYFLCGAIPNTIAIILGKVISVGVPMLILCWLLSFVVALAVVYSLNRFVPFVFDLRKLKSPPMQRTVGGKE